MNMKRMRGICVLVAVVAIPILGLLFHTGTGNLSTFGVDSLAIICPVGALEAMLGSKNIALRGVLCIALTVVLVLLLGKVLCAWACPFPWLQKFFQGKKCRSTIGASSADGASSSEGTVSVGEGQAVNAAASLDVAGSNPDASVSGSCPSVSVLASDGSALLASSASGCSGHCVGCGKALLPVGGKRDGLRLDSRHLVLAGALGSSAIFGFPVFCLVCPIGLTFTILIGVWHLFAFNETTWGLVVFPVILLLEVTLLRKWCTRFCPVSALLSLVSSGNRLFRPSVNSQLCLREDGTDCRACVNACPEKLDPHSNFIPECSKCGQCASACPAKAITFPLVRPSTGNKSK